MALEILRDYDLTASSTFGTKAVAERFVRVTSEVALREALTLAEAGSFPVTLLGGGANTIFRARVPGLVVQLALRGFVLTEDPSGEVILEVGAGEVLDDVIDRLLEAGVGGLENLAAIPGTIGGAIVQNAGAYGLEIAERVVSVRVMRPDGSIETYDTQTCDFGYRHSRFKTEAGRGEIVLSVRLHFPKEWVPKVDYKDLETYRKAHPEVETTPAGVAAAVRAVRAQKLPDPKVIGNAGSFFKNPVVEKVVWHHILKFFPGIPSYPLGGGRRKLAAAWMIEAAGWKGVKRGAVGVFPRHALILTNLGGATGEDVLAVADALRGDVEQKFGVRLELEPVVVGEG